MGCGCIPVIIGDKYVLPFSELIDWKEFSITIPENRVEEVASILQRVAYSSSPQLPTTISTSSSSSLRGTHLETMQRRSLKVFEEKLESFDKLVESVLTILKRRIYNDRYYLLRPNDSS